MLNDVVSTGNTMAGRMISGFLAMSLDHPFVLCLIVSAMAGSACAVLLDAIGPLTEPRPVTVEAEPKPKPAIRPRRS